MQYYVSKKKNDCYLLLGPIVSTKLFICNLLRYSYTCIITYYNFKINIVMKSTFVSVLNFFNNSLQLKYNFIWRQRHLT